MSLSAKAASRRPKRGVERLEDLAELAGQFASDIDRSALVSSSSATLRKRWAGHGEQMDRAMALPAMSAVPGSGMEMNDLLRMAVARGYAPRDV